MSLLLPVPTSRRIRQLLLPHSLLQVHASRARLLKAGNSSGIRCFACRILRQAMYKTSSGELHPRGSVHRHHVATGQRSLDLSRVATSKLLSKASDPPGVSARQGVRTLSSRVVARVGPFVLGYLPWLPAKAPNGSRLPCRAGFGDVRPLTCLDLRPDHRPGSRRVLLKPHSQSPGQSALVLAGGYHSALPRDLPRLVIGIESTVRSLDGPPVRS